MIVEPPPFLDEYEYLADPFIGKLFVENKIQWSQFNATIRYVKFTLQKNRIEDYAIGEANNLEAIRSILEYTRLYWEPALQQWIGFLTNKYIEEAMHKWQQYKTGDNSCRIL